MKKITRKFPERVEIKFDKMTGAKNKILER